MAQCLDTPQTVVVQRVFPDGKTDEVEKSKGYIARAEGQAQAQKQVAESSLLSIEG